MERAGLFREVLMDFEETSAWFVAIRNALGLPPETADVDVFSAVRDLKASHDRQCKSLNGLGMPLGIIDETAGDPNRTRTSTHSVQRRRLLVKFGDQLHPGDWWPVRYFETEEAARTWMQRAARKGPEGVEWRLWALD